MLASANISAFGTVIVITVTKFQNGIIVKIIVVVVVVVVVIIIIIIMILFMFA